MNKLKILYIITKSDVGGAQKYVADLANNLDKDKFDAKILCGGKDLRRLSNKVRPWMLFLNDWLAIFELVGTFRSEQPDIIHLNSSKAGVLGSLAAFLYKTLYPKPSTLNPKIVFTAHGWVFNPTNDLSAPIRWFYILLHKFAARFQDKIICVSEYDYHLATQYNIAPKEKLVAIHNGINPDMKFLDKETARNEILMRIRGFNDTDTSALSAYNSHHRHYDWPWIGSVGRLVKEKNYETLIEAAALINATTADNKQATIAQPYFFIIGAGAEYAQLKAKSSQLKANIFFIDPTGDDAKYLKAFDIFTMSSIKEGLPYILLEAMAAGLPIVVTEAGGIPEIIKSHKNGMMVAQKNPKQLAQAISGLLANPMVADELGKSAKSAVAEHFSAQKMVEKTENTYNSLKNI